MAQSSDSGSGPDLVAAIEQAAAQMRAAIDALDERSGIDTHTMTELIGAQLSDLHRGVALSQEAAAVHHDAIASRLASLQAEAATTPDLLASVREAVLDARGDALARHIELQSTLQAIAGDLVAQLGELRSMVGEGTDRGDLEQAITASIAEVRSALDAVQTAGADQTRDLHHAIGTSTDRIAGGQADLRHAIEASADTRAIEDAIAATNDRIAELRAALEGVQDVTLTNTRELQAGIAAATDRISGDVDRLYQATENGPDLTPVTGALAELRGAVDDVFHAGGGNARGLHDAITSATDRLAAELGQVRAAAQAGPDLSPVTGPLSELLSGIDSIHEAGTANTRDLRETIAAATDRIAEIRTAVAAGRDEAGSNARELREALGTATDRVAGQLDRLEEAIERGPDVTALTTAMDEVRSMVAAANDAIERTAAGPALADLREAIAAVRGTVTLAQQGLAADLASTRDIVRTGIDEMSSGLTIRSDATTAAIERITEQLSGFEHTAEHALEWSDETGARLASIERELGAGREQLEIVPQRLAELADRAGRTSDDISAIAHWTSVHDTPERLEDLAGSLDSKLASLAEVVPSLQGALLDTRAAFERANEGLIGSLDGLRSHLTANGGFTAQSERIRELRTAVEELARHVAETEAAAGGREGVGAASGTIAQLQTTVEGLLTRFEDRTNTLTTRSASLESLVEQSVRQLESQVKDVLTGLGANDRLVRGRFEQLETTLSALRGDVTQIRSLRAEMESLGGAVDDLRNRVAR
ncbi:MAG: hypothetical protein QOG64_1145, partial [Acidimicrobiaceae bacterium]|nr:hypothetical protein [Acidimicrobiaceae bacterium]